MVQKMQIVTRILSSYMAHFLVQRMFRQEQCHIPRHFLYNAFYTSSTDSSSPLVSYRKNEEAEPQWRWCRVDDVFGGESKAQCCVEQYHTGTCSERSMKQGKLDMVKQKMAKVNKNILGISELKQTELGN